MRGSEIIPASKEQPGRTSSRICRKLLRRRSTCSVRPSRFRSSTSVTLVAVRYTEVVRAHFGVISPDGRLQRPEYLGGGQSTVNLHAVAQTSNVNAQPTPQGNLAAFGTSTLSGGHGFTKSFTEHCVIIGLVSVRADLNYQQGLNRMFSRRTRWDFLLAGARAHWRASRAQQGNLYSGHGTR